MVNFTRLQVLLVYENTFESFYRVEAEYKLDFVPYEIGEEEVES